MSRTRTTLGLALCAALAAATAGAAEPVAIPGTRVSLEIPADFALSSAFPGIVDPDGFSTLMVSEVPTGVAAMRAALTEEKLAAGGMTLIRVEEVAVAETTGTLVHASQTARGNVYRKWILVFGSDEATVSLIASTPKVMEDRTAGPLRGAMLSARWEPEKQVDPFDGLGFALTETEELRVSDRISNMIFLTRPPGAAPAEPHDPVLVAGASKRFGRVEDLEQLARMRIEQISEIRDIRFGSGGELEVAGLPGYELEASARDLETGAPIRVYQLLLVEKERTILLQGLVSEDRGDRFVPQFREVAKSLRKTD